MKEKAPLEAVDPLCLPVGTRIGPWRVVGFKGRGAYGTVYRVEHESREPSGPFALKLAITPGDERFAREAWLLSRIRSPYVPQLYAQGVWEHPSGAYPYLVMQWVDGEPLYEWAARRNPSERQIFELVTQVARALEATHAAGGVHRDVKGANVLVRLADGRAFLTDFGAGHYRGAATLTSKLLPPGTPAYRSPEAWGFLRLFLRHPTVHYPASASDDLFALGVMAYRLVTDEYPPSTHPDEPGAEVWREGGPGPRPPRELNPRVSPDLDALILKLLSTAPVDRFNGKAREAAEALEQAARDAKPTTASPLFLSGHVLRPRWRSPGAVQRAEERDAAVREALGRREERERDRAEPASQQVALQTRVSLWGAEVAVAAAGLLLACLMVAWLYRAPEAAQTAAKRDASEERIVAMGDNASAISTTSAPVRMEGTKPTVGLPMPEKSLPGQRNPPCNRTGEVELRGSCWFPLRDIKPPCKEEGKEDAYDWKGACYSPSYPAQRQPTSDPP